MYEGTPLYRDNQPERTQHSADAVTRCRVTGTLFAVWPPIARSF